MRLRADQQIFLSHLLLISVLAAALSFGAESLVRRHLMGTVEGDVRREVAMGRAMYDAEAGAPAVDLAERLGRLSGRRVTIVARDGRVVAETDPPGGGVEVMTNHRARPEIGAALSGRVGADVRRSTTVGTPHLYVATPTARGEILRFAVPLAEIDEAMARVQRGILGVAAVAVLLAGLLSLGFSVLVTRPLRRIRDAARSMAGGDLTHRLRERRGDELGDLAGALDTLADELQRRLAQLEGERVETQALIDSMSEGVLALTPEGRVRRANPAARQMFSLPPDPRGMSPEAVARRPDFLRLVARAVAGEAVPPGELQSDGRVILATAHPLPDGGAVLVFLDVSELRRLEGVRRDFVANASHELKTPLTAIRGYSETLLDPDLPPELRHRFAETVKSNADRLQRIVDDLLDLSRIESGGWRVETGPVDVAAVAEGAWRAQAGGAGDRGLRFTVEVDPGAERALGDDAALHQVFTNLFSNAIRYTAEGGAIAVHARPRGAGWLEVEVSDTGSGIPAAHLPRIFERFYRADPARSRAEGGTGLGLAIVKHLVEAHDGVVEAESEMGRGTIIRFTLPVAPNPGHRTRE